MDETQTHRSASSSGKKSHPSRSAIRHLPGPSLGVVPAGLPLSLAAKQISEKDVTPVQKEGIAGKLELGTRLETPQAPVQRVRVTVTLVHPARV